jgi:hypothetical protein
MADDDKTQDTSATEDDKPDTELGEGGKKALEQERRARKAAEKSMKDLQTRLAELEDKDKSEGDKLRDQLKQAEKDRDDARLSVMRLEIASSKGLTPAQAKRLVGATKEDLEADADELLESFKPADDKTPPDDKPRERLKGGGDPTEEPEPDLRKLVADIPRGFA